MNTTRTKVTEYQLLDHGIDHAQYFQGCGTAFTKYDHCVTGCGDNPAEALADSLDSIAQDGFDAEALEALILAEEGGEGYRVILRSSKITGVTQYDCIETIKDFLQDIGGQLVGSYIIHNGTVYPGTVEGAWQAIEDTYGVR